MNVKKDKKPSQPEPEFRALLEKAEQASPGTAKRGLQAAIQRKQVIRRSKRTVNGLHSNRNAQKRQGKR